MSAQVAADVEPMAMSLVRQPLCETFTMKNAAMAVQSHMGYAGMYRREAISKTNHPNGAFMFRMPVVSCVH